MAVDHYENFPVASLLCPPALRPAVTAIYWFARTADDIADEGDATPAERIADLCAYRTELRAATNGGPIGERWRKVFSPLRAAVHRHALPVSLLEDLLSAFEQDVTRTRYADRADLLDYCRRSANPIGRMLLHLYGVHDAEAQQQSDAVCSALQLVNFWQDLGIDTARGRLYIPQADCDRYGVRAETVLAREDDAATRALVAEVTGWARSLMLSGAPLVHRLAGRAGWELRLVVQGGLRVLDKIEALAFATLSSRPQLRWHDAPTIAWRALRMRPVAPRSLREARP